MDKQARAGGSHCSVLLPRSIETIEYHTMSTDPISPKAESVMQTQTRFLNCQQYCLFPRCRCDIPDVCSRRAQSP